MNSTTPRSDILNAEAALIGAALRAPDRHLAALLDTPLDRYTSPFHRAVAAAVHDLAAQGITVDEHTVAGHLELTNPEKDQYLSLLGAGWIANIDGYLALIDHHWRRRETRAQLVEALRLADEGDHDGALTRAQAALDVGTGNRRAKLTTLSDAIEAHLDLLEARAAGGSTGLPTGWADIDRILGGLRPGQLITICGRPGMGKSAIAGGLALNATTAGTSTLVVSIEMSIEELIDRYYATTTRIPMTKLRGGRIAPVDWQRIATATGQLAELPLHVLDDPGATLTAIRDNAKRANAGLVIVDYLQLMTPASKRDNRQVEVAEISGGLKRMARDLDAPVVALAQLNRSVELRADKRPQLADLRESGAIENDSDAVIGLYRDEYYTPETRDQGVLEAHVLKQRNGPTGKARLAYFADTNWIGDLARP